MLILIVANAIIVSFYFDKIYKCCLV